MTYRVLDNEAINVMSTNNGHGSTYADVVESALNNMEKQGFVLVAIEQDSTGDENPLYVLHRPNA